MINSLLLPHAGSPASSHVVATRVRRVVHAVLLVAASTLVQAAEPTSDKTRPGEEGGLQEVTVTARYASESLQRTPVAITALTGDELAARGLGNIGDLGKSAPSVTLQKSFGGFGKSTIAAIRGIGQYDFLPAFEPGVGMYIDDVYHGTLYGSLVELTDIDRVEIVRGPQGTLFGKDNEGGAVRIFSKQPVGDNSGYLQAGYGHFERVQIKGAFDTAIVPDKLLLRVSGGVDRHDGYMDQIDFACANPSLAGNLKRTTARTDCKVGTLGGDDSTAVRAALRWNASDTLVVNLNSDLLVSRGEPTADKVLAYADPVAHPASLLNLFNPSAITNPAYGIPLDSRFITDSPYKTYATYDNVDNGHSFPKVSDITSWGVGLTINWQLPAGVKVTNILGYRNYEGEFTEAWSGAPININTNYFRPYHKQLSDELRLSGRALENKLEWTAGAYYYNALTELNDFIDLPVLFGFNFYGRDPVRDEDKSGFLHGVYHVTEAFSVEAGLRYSSLTKRYEFDRNILTPFVLQPPITPFPIPFQNVVYGFENRPVVTSSADHLDQRLALQYQWTDDVMTYVQYSTGFKGGGVNPRPVTAGDLSSFDPETLKSYEIGAKTQWFNNRLRANVAAYWSDYKDLQLNAVTPGSASGAVSNTGKARIYGLEGEFLLEPVQDMLLNVSFGYLNYKNQDLGNAAGVADGPTLNSVPPYTPEWKYSLGGQYAFRFAGGGSITPRLDWTYQTKTYNDLFNSEEAASDGYGLLDAHVTYASEAAWQLTFELMNATNKEYYINKFNQLNGSGMLVGQPGMPRTWLMSLRRNF